MTTSILTVNNTHTCRFSQFLSFVSCKIYYKIQGIKKYYFCNKSLSSLQNKSLQQLYSSPLTISSHCTPRCSNYSNLLINELKKKLGGGFLILFCLAINDMPRLAPNSLSSCLNFTSAGITGMPQFFWLYHVLLYCIQVIQH